MRRYIIVLCIVGIGVCAGCGSKEPATDAERLARGREIVQHMSDKLGSTPAFTVATSEIREEVRPGGATQRVSVTRETTIRRPNRLYSTVSGDRRNEVWYDGVGITLVMHDDKVFGQARAPETLDKTLDAIYERFGIQAPFADYVYSSPVKALIADSTTGGWVARETLDGKPVDHLAFKDKGVNWDAWIAADGDPLPRKATAEFPGNKRLRRTEMVFTNWNLSPQIADTRFDPSVPKDYEGIAIVQRARVLRNMPKDDSTSQPKPAEPQK